MWCSVAENMLVCQNMKNFDMFIYFFIVDMLYISSTEISISSTEICIFSTQIHISSTQIYMSICTVRVHMLAYLFNTHEAAEDNV